MDVSKKQGYNELMEFEKTIYNILKHLKSSSTMKHSTLIYLITKSITFQN